MAEKYTILVNPQVSASDGQKMENDLNRRFANVSKKFGTHLKNSLTTSLKAGAAAGIAGTIALLATNPFEKVQADLHNTLNTADDIVTRARQFGVSTAKFAQLQAIANSVGIEVDMALQQFSSKLQEARDYKAGDETKSRALEQFVNNKDIIENFYDFIKSVGSLPATQRNAEIGKVYGDKIQLKIAELVDQTIDVRKKQVKPTLGTFEDLGKANEKLAEREDQAAIARVRRQGDEAIRKSRVITSGTINVDDAVERAKINKEVQQLSQFEIYARQAALQEEMLKSIDKLRAHVMDVAFPALQKAVEILGAMVDKLTQVIDWLKTIAGKTRKFFGG